MSSRPLSSESFSAESFPIVPAAVLLAMSITGFFFRSLTGKDLQVFTAVLKLVVRLMVRSFALVGVPTLQDFFHLPNKLLLIRHIQDIPGCKYLVRQTAQRIFDCYAVLVGAKDDADRRIIFRVIDFCCVVVQIHIDLTGGFGRELGGFQLDQHIGVQNLVVEHHST